MTLKQLNYLLVIFMYLLVIVFGLRATNFEYPSNIMPWFLLSVIAVLTTIIFLQNLLSNDPALKAKPFQDSHKGRVLTIVIAAVVYILLIPIIGFYVTSLLFLILGGISFSGNWHNPRMMLSIAGLFLLVTVIIYAGFWLFLKVPTPTGILM